ncbi:MAG TPA: LPS assembly protein LptD [Magnetospirillaceae bacterium]|jgi:LPS-assembly protein
MRSPARRLTVGISIMALMTALASPTQADTTAAPVSGAGPSNGASLAPAVKGKDGKKGTDQPALITADQIIYDRDLSTVTASGHVEIDQAGRVLLADAVSYNLKQDVIIATGNVSFTDIDGEVRFTDYIELSGDMKQAVARHLRLLMVDNSRFAAATGRRTDGTRNILDDAIYTACEPCAADPSSPPLWDVRAQRIVHDDTTHRISYDDAWFDVDGFPVMYFPYFSHSDPSVKRESGVLPPTFFSNAIVGTGLAVPYYQIISPYQDATIEPIYTSKEGAGGAANWRARTTFGEMTTSASFGNEPETSNVAATSTGWDVDAKSQFAIDDTWRTGYDIERASDRDYLRYYDYPLNEPYLTTRPYLEGFSSRSYFAVEAYSFQNQTDNLPAPEPGIPDKSPLVLPLVTYSVQSHPGWEGSYVSFDTHSASILRTDDETNSRRVNTLAAWHLPYTSNDGEVYNFTASVRADAYDSDHVIGYGPQQEYAYRLIPTTSVDWRLPMAKIEDHSTQTFTPILMANIGPYGGNDAKIPNEDSLDFELDDSNIFNPQLFSGYDRVASGPRVAYGGEYTLTNRGSSTADILLGQSYQPKPDNVFPVGTGLDHPFSDLVGRAEVAPSQNLNLTYHFRLSETDYSFRHSELDLNAGSRPLSATIGYVFLDDVNEVSNFGLREQIVGSLQAQITRRWSAQIYDNSNLGPGGGPLQTGARLSYEDECTILQLDGGMRNTTVNTIVAGHYVILRIVLKTLTQFPVSLF